MQNLLKTYKYLKCLISIGYRVRSYVIRNIFLNNFLIGNILEIYARDILLSLINSGGYGNLFMRENFKIFQNPESQLEFQPGNP